MAKDFGDIVGQEQDQNKYAYNRCCTANGCFMAAGQVTEWWGPEAGARNGAPKAGVCAYHAAAKSFQWQKVTNNLHKAKPLITIYHRLNSLPIYQLGKMEPLEIDGFPKTKPKIWVEPSTKEGEPDIERREDIYSWLNRIRDLIWMASQHKLPEEPTKKAQQGITMQTILAEAGVSAKRYDGGV